MHEVVQIVAKDFIILPLLLMIITWWRLERQQKRRFIILAILSGVLAGALAVLASHLYKDPRPFVVGHFRPYFPHGADNGFVSDHTLLGIWAAAITLVYSRRLGWLALVLALLVGLARVVAGVHHLVDIIAAAVISVGSVLIMKQVLKALARTRQKNAS
ncbi:MAG TPA: phosphatase PAP2 family protein [Candidatus Saccharimonadales bacterium]|nr:phosphatase PAP2 family protein [Candidatus Saccharimonadales bacterium]